MFPGRRISANAISNLVSLISEIGSFAARSAASNANHLHCPVAKPSFSGAGAPAVKNA
jgi:hypothetical protein